MGQPAALPCAAPAAFTASNAGQAPPLCWAARGPAHLEGSLLFPRPWDLHALTQVVLTALTEGARHRGVKSHSRSPSKASSDLDLYTSRQSKSADSLGQGSPTSGI